MQIEALTATTAPQLKLHNPARPQAQRHRRRRKRPLTLQAAFEKWILPRMLLRRAPATIAEDYRALDRFSRMWRLLNPRTASPGVPIGEVTEDALSQITTLLLSQADGALASDSVRKCLSSVRKVLREAHYRGLIDRVPRSPELPRSLSEPLPLELGDVERLAQHTDVCDWPTLGKLPPAEVWRDWLTVFWITGLRTQDAVATKSAVYPGLEWHSVHLDARCPIGRLRLEHAPGWLFLLPHKTRHSRPEKLLLPLHPRLRAVLDRYRGLDAHRVWPNGRSKQRFYANWRRLVLAAGLPDDASISGESSPSLRRGCSNNWDDVREGFGERVLGHTPRGTNARHYRQVLRRMIRLLPELALPPSLQ